MRERERERERDRDRERRKIEQDKVPRVTHIHIGHQSLVKGSQGNPIRTIRDYWELLGLIRVNWEDWVPLP